MSAHRGQSAGFTLIELLVALFITAILFAMGYAALDQALRGRREVEEQAARLVAVQHAMRLLEQDFELAQPRPVRNADGTGWQAAVVGGTASGLALASTLSGGDAAPVVTLTRGGWSNPAGVQRSELQRVTWGLRDHHLVRAWWPELDPVSGTEPVQRELLDRVRSLTLRFMDDGHRWQDAWPAAAVSATDLRQLRARPVAVEITLELEDWGRLVRIVEIAG